MCDMDKMFQRFKTFLHDNKITATELSQKTGTPLVVVANTLNGNLPLKMPLVILTAWAYNTTVKELSTGPTVYQTTHSNPTIREKLAYYMELDEHLDSMGFF